MTPCLPGSDAYRVRRPGAEAAPQPASALDHRARRGAWVSALLGGAMALLSLSLDAAANEDGPASAQVRVTVNGSSFRAGEALRLGLAVQNEFLREQRPARLRSFVQRTPDGEGGELLETPASLQHPSMRSDFMSAASHSTAVFSGVYHMSVPSC